MSEGRFEEGKGRAKEAMGDLTDDDALKREGKIDRASGAAKSKFEAIVDRIKEPFRRRVK